MQIVGFVDDTIIDSVFLISETYMLFYFEDDKFEEDIRAVNHIKYAKFYELETANEILITGLLNYEILNVDRNIIFESVKTIKDEELIIKYGFIKTQLANNESIS